MKKFIEGVIIEKSLHILSSFIKIPSLVIIIISNLFPVFGMFVLGWDITNILVLYWMENLIIGFYNVIKMIIVSRDKPQPYAKDVSQIIFFIIHFGIFTFGHARILATILSITFGHDIDYQYLLIHNLPGFLLLLVSHGFSLYYHFILKNEYQKTSIDQLLFKPYGRIVIMHISTMFCFIIFAVVLSTTNTTYDQNFGFSSLGIVAPLILILIKILFEIKNSLDPYRRNTKLQR